MLGRQRPGSDGIVAAWLACRDCCLSQLCPAVSAVCCDWLQETGPPTPLLDTINYPVHLKNLGLNDLKKLSKELRAGELACRCCGARQCLQAAVLSCSPSTQIGLCQGMQNTALCYV